MLLLVLGVLVALPLFLLIWILRSDCDLTLQWAEKFGDKIETLRGQVIWITGASSGIGEALAYKLASAGCRLVLSARRTEDLERVKKQCLLSGPLKEEDIMVLTLDSTKFDTHAAAVEKVLERFKQIDVLVNNAGRSQRAGWMDISLEVDRQMLETNVLGVLSLTKCVLPHMIERKAGHIVVTSSAAGKFGAPFSASYTGSKHAIHGWFETLRIEGAEHNIDVTLLCPGPVFSRLFEQAFTGEPGQVLGRQMEQNEKRMSTERCAHLCAVAIANRLDEAWMALQPVLMGFYLSQYAPSFYRGRMKRMGLTQLLKIREGK